MNIVWQRTEGGGKDLSRGYTNEREFAVIHNASGAKGRLYVACFDWEEKNFTGHHGSMKEAREWCEGKLKEFETDNSGVMLRFKEMERFAENRHNEILSRICEIEKKLDRIMADGTDIHEDPDTRENKIKEAAGSASVLTQKFPY